MSESTFGKYLYLIEGVHFSTHLGS